MQKVICVIILFCILICSCTTKLDKQGYIVITHVGEENKPIQPYAMTLPTDTSYLQYVTSSTDEFSIIRELHQYPYNRDTIDYELFLKIKRVLEEYKVDNNKDFEDVRSLSVNIDDSGVITNILMPCGVATAQCLDKLIEVSKKADRPKMTRRFEYYRNIQRVPDRLNE